jgi:hypothetical protein
VFGPLSAGTHTYRIQVTDANGQTASASGSFLVAPASSPVISSVVVAEAVPQNGILESNEQGVITWSDTDPNTITSRSLTVDGAPVTPLNGPYGPYAGGTYNNSGVFGPLAAGTHSFTIQVTDGAGGSASYNGTFTVVAPALTRALSASQAASVLPAILASAVDAFHPAADAAAALLAPAGPRVDPYVSLPDEAALGTPVAALAAGNDPARDGQGAEPALADQPAPAGVGALTPADRVELLGAVVRELTPGGDFAD